MIWHWDELVLIHYVFKVIIFIDLSVTLDVTVAEIEIK